MSAVEGVPEVKPEPTTEERQAAEVAEQLRRSLAATAQADQALGQLVSLLA